MAARLETSAPLAAVLGAALLLGLAAGVNPQLGVAGAIGVVFVAAVFVDLAVGVAALALLSFVDVLPSVGAVSLPKLAGVLLVISWIAVSARGRQQRISAVNPVLTYLLVLFFGWAAISAIWAESQGDSVTALGRYAPNLLLIPIVFTALRTRRQAVWILAAVVVGAAIAATAGLLDPPADPAAAAGGPRRVTGTIGDANELAAALLLGLFVAGGFAANPGFPPRWRVSCLAVLTLSLAGIMLSLSRGGLIALAVAMLIGVVVSGRWRPRVAVLAGVVVSAAFFYFALFASLPARERVTELGGGTGRVDLWTVGWRMVEDKPIGGVGVGNFRDSSIHYLLRPGVIERDDFIVSSPKVAHNTYLQILAETGIVGLLLFLAILGLSLGSVLVAARAFERAQDVQMEIISRALFAGLAGYLVAIFFISEMYSKVMWLLLACGPPLMLMARRSSRQPPAAATHVPAAPGRGARAG